MDRRATAGRRLLLAYLGFVAAVAVVVVIGTAVQPTYGSLSPFGGTHYADVRTQPRPGGWSRDLGAVFAPSAPPECVVFHSQGVDERDELVTATVPTASSSGQNAECELSSPKTPGVLAMIDPTTGLVSWTTDLATELRTTVYSLVAHPSVTAGVIVVGIDGSHGDVLLALDLDTGKILSSGTAGSADEVINFAVSGELVLSVVPDSGGTLETYLLRRIDDLSKAIWTQAMSSTIFPELLPDRVVVPMPNETVVVDGGSGRVSRWGANIWRNQGVQVVGDQVLSVAIGLGVGVTSSLVLYAADGTRVWSVPANDIAALAVSRTCILVSSGDGTLSCHDRATGRTRWSSAMPGEVSGTPDGSTTDDILVTGTVRSGDETLRVTELDAASGRARFSTTIPRGATVAGQARSTGYALDSSGTDGNSRLSAFDLDTGHALWTYSASEVEVWGGRLVDITARGIARELVDGRASAEHGMLVG